MVSGLYCAQGITAALLARERSGQGQRVDIGMLDTTAALLTYQAANWFATGKIPQRQGNRHATIAPYETFTTKDGEIVIAVGNDEIWKRFCAAVDLEELAADPRPGARSTSSTSRRRACTSPTSRSCSRCCSGWWTTGTPCS